jgi:hypothetical protein
MGLHVLGRKCPVCHRKGLVIGADDGFAFRPQGWLMKRLNGRQVACPHCGAIMIALLPEDLKTLRKALRAERETEVVTYHSKPKRKKAPPADEE